MTKAEQVSLLLFQCWRHPGESVPGQVRRATRCHRASERSRVCTGWRWRCVSEGVGGVGGDSSRCFGQRSWHEEASPALPL